MKTSKKIIIPVFFSMVLVACEQDSSPANPTASPAARKSDDTPAAVQAIEKYLAENTGNKVHAEISSAKEDPFGSVHSGEVLETFEASKLTYVNVKSTTGSTWAAGPLTNIKAGDIVSFNGKSAMKNFHSKSINRTFELIYFVSVFNVKGAEVESKNTATDSSSK